MFNVVFFLLIPFLSLFSTQIEDKVLICGVCKNIERAVPNTIASARHLGSQFSNYRVIVYENNSYDKTAELLQVWAQEDPEHIVFISEKILKADLAKEMEMGVRNRTELIARARNIVLDIAMDSKYDDYKYVIWADLDFLDPWDVEHVVETILHPEQEWDGVFANGSYDLFALRDSQFPIGFELIGEIYWKVLDDMRAEFKISREDPWRKVYSAFGGLGIYKRDALKGCRYSGVITRDFEKAVIGWLKAAEAKFAANEHVLFLDIYHDLLKQRRVKQLRHIKLSNPKSLPKGSGIKLCNQYGLAQIVWFSCTKGCTLPWTCEHLTLHAAMAAKGHDRFFINPRIVSVHP